VNPADKRAFGYHQTYILNFVDVSFFGFLLDLSK
jgi:hypothetical protein